MHKGKTFWTDARDVFLTNQWGLFQLASTEAATNLKFSVEGLYLSPIQP